MRGHHVLIALAIFEMWPMDARPKAARCACGRIPADTGANMLLSDVKSYGLASASGGRDRYWCMIVGR
jgi:hypothetical protein